MKTALNFTLIALGVGFLILLFVFKDRMNTMVSEKMTKQVTHEQKTHVKEYIDSAFNYTGNGLPYQITFLEFGATGCVACRRMEKVMAQTRENYPEIVQVLFINVLFRENQDLMKYYGIASIPVQVLLDPTGREYFRHTGYISFHDLKTAFDFK